MRAIVKGREPQSLTEHRRTPHSDYDNYPGQVQGCAPASAGSRADGGCAAIAWDVSDPTANAMKIEHWQVPRRAIQQSSSSTAISLARVGAVKASNRSSSQHCDTRKGDDLDLRWNPAEPAHAIEAKVQYGTDGTIKSDDDAFDRQLNEVLNLNLAFLKNHRKGVLDAVLEWWREHGPVPRRQIEREVRRHAPEHGQLAALPPSRGLVAELETRADAVTDTLPEEYGFRSRHQDAAPAYVADA